MSYNVLKSFSKSLQIMSFDFFNEGLKKDAAPQFSNEENLFLQSKLPFLDPKKTNSIQIGNALDFLKFSGLRSERIQKILKNCISEPGKKTLTYDQMKKIFRGVALVQNDIEPSSINISANIKTKMPIFYDEDSEDQGGDQPKAPAKQAAVSQAPSKPPIDSMPASKPQEVKPQQDKLNVFQGVFPPTALTTRPSQQLEKSNFAQFPPMQPSNHFSQSQSQTHSQSQSQSHNHKPSPQHPDFNTKIKQFQIKWKKLKTQGNKIDGAEVKNLCKKLSDRSILSRAWKLCCLSNPGSLTKGEFFVFLQMVSNNKIPEQLSSEMKALIQEVDKQSSQPSKPVANTTSTPKTNSTAPQGSTFTQLGASQLFQNFTKIQAKSATETKIVRQDEATQKIMARVVQAKKQVENNHNGELTDLRRGQQTMNNLMGQLEQYITAVDARTNNWNSQIEELKQGQLLLNDRLNKVCMGMNSVIMKQHALIEDLVSNMATQNSINNQRVNVLENHISEIQQQLEVREQQLAQFVRQSTAEKAQALENKVQPNPQIRQPRPSPQPQKKETHEQQHPPTRPTIVQRSSQPQRQQVKHEQQSPAQQTQKAVTQDEEQEYQHRMKNKRAQVLQLIMYLTPLTQEEMPALIQRISEYSQEELTMVYINCYQKLQARQELEAQRAAQMRAAEDDFSSSNFKGEAVPTQNMFQ